MSQGCGHEVQSVAELSPAAIKNMLRMENELRLCDRTMEYYNEARRAGRDPMEVPVQIQREVARAFNLSEDIALAAMRCAETLPQMSPQDVAEVKEISHYRKFNRCQDGSLQVGDSLPDVPLVRFRRGGGGEITSLHSTLPSSPSLSASRPSVVVAASYS